MLVFVFPDPLDFMLFVFKLGDIVDLVAGFDHRLHIFGRLNFRVSMTMAHCLAFRALAPFLTDNFRMRFAALLRRQKHPEPVWSSNPAPKSRRFLKSVFCCFPLLVLLRIINMAIPAVRVYRSIVVAPVAKFGLVGMAVQTGVGKAHVKFFAVGVDINPFGVPHHRMPPEI